jgi:hypothetical protein
MVLVVVFVFILSIETGINVGLDFENNDFAEGIASSYIAVKEAILFDPYNEQILENVDKFREEVNGVFTKRIDGINALLRDPDFDSQILSYFVFRRLESERMPVRKYLEGYRDFRDFVVIDQNKSLIYKHGAETISIEFFDLDGGIAVKNFRDLYGIIIEQDDTTLDYKFQALALFDMSELELIVELSDFPIFFHINNNVIENQNVPRGLVSKYAQSFGDKDRFYEGAKIIEIFSLGTGNYVAGYAGIIYPVRSVVSYLLIILKILVLIGLCFGVYVLDSIIKVKIKHHEAKRQADEVVEIPDFIPPPAEKNEDDTEEKSLNWVEHYIHDSEMGKK